MSSSAGEGSRPAALRGAGSRGAAPLQPQIFEINGGAERDWRGFEIGYVLIPGTEGLPEVLLVRGVEPIERSVDQTLLPQETGYEKTGFSTRWFGLMQSKLKQERWCISAKNQSQNQ